MKGFLFYMYGMVMENNSIGDGGCGEGWSGQKNAVLKNGQGVGGHTSHDLRPVYVMVTTAYRERPYFFSSE